MYSSSLTDDEWLIIEPLLPKKKLTCPLTWTKREILDGVFYQLKNGCNWGDLPKDLPPYSTVYWHYKQWRSQGIIQKIMETLHKRLRHQKERNLWTTLIMIDSQAVKNTCNASVETKGFCFYKCTNGITAISDQTHHEKAISKAQSRDHNVGTNQEHFHQ